MTHEEAFINKLLFNDKDPGLFPFGDQQPNESLWPYDLR